MGGIAKPIAHVAKAASKVAGGALKIASSIPGVGGAGGFLSTLSGLASVVGSLQGQKTKTVQVSAPAIPTLPKEAVAEPEVVIAEDAAKRRAILRSYDTAFGGTFARLTESPNTTKRKTLLGG